MLSFSVDLELRDFWFYSGSGDKWNLNEIRRCENKYSLYAIEHVVGV